MTEKIKIEKETKTVKNVIAIVTVAIAIGTESAVIVIGNVNEVPIATASVIRM